MKQSTLRPDGTILHISINWPDYLFGYGGGALVILIVILISSSMGWYAFVSLSIAATIVLTFFLAASLWSIHQISDNDELRDLLFTMGSVKPEDEIAFLDLGFRHRPISYARKLTTGQLTVLDVYNPQLTPRGALARAQRISRSVISESHGDPRLEWKEASITLLPIQDRSLDKVFAVMTLSEFVQEGDRVCLLGELKRILKPDGSLLLAEHVRTPTNLMVKGPAYIRLPSPSYWQHLLKSAGFEVVGTRIFKDMISCVRAVKPDRNAPRQLTIEF